MGESKKNYKWIKEKKNLTFLILVWFLDVKVERETKNFNW